MSNIEGFEDLIAWHKARLLTKAIYQSTRQGAFAKDFGLSAQIQRAAVSIMPNIAEGFERKGSAEFHHFLSVAKASSAELRSQLYIAFDVGYLNQEDFNRLLTQATEVARILGGLRASIERKRDQQKSKTSR
jgi:four helix bundle protein